MPGISYDFSKIKGYLRGAGKRIGLYCERVKMHWILMMSYIPTGLLPGTMPF
jgi:hypothetical protein